MKLEVTPPTGPLRYSTTQDDVELTTFLDTTDKYAAHYIQHTSAGSGSDAYVTGNAFVIDSSYSPTSSSTLGMKSFNIKTIFDTDQTITSGWRPHLIETYISARTGTLNAWAFRNDFTISSSCDDPNTLLSGIRNAVATTAAGTIGRLRGIESYIQTSASTPFNTVTTAINFYSSISIGSSCTGTTLYGFYEATAASGTITTFVGFYVANAPGTTSIGFYSKQAACQNRFVGPTKFGADSAPTAQIHCAAHSTSASSAPIKLVTGTAMTTPEDGAIEYHSSHLYFTISSTRYQLDQQVPTTQTKYNTPATTTSYTSTTTLGDITGLTGFTLVASKTYSVEGAIIASSGSGTPDLNIGVDFSSAPTSIGIGYTSATDEGQITADNTNSAAINVVSTANTCVQISGTFKAGAGAGTLAFRACQNASNGTAVVVEAGTWIKITQLD